jgi:light-harvesting complex I chlorophyll a/b binding protein 4
MKLSIGILATLLAQNASAFTSPSANRASVTSLASAVADSSTKSVDLDDVKYETEVNVEQKFKVADVDPKINDPKYRVQTGRYDEKEMSIAMPMLKRPSKLDGTHAGDVGFDPLGFSESNDMYTLMESEIRHARLAMLAVVGWPLSELFAPNWMLHGPNHIAPSVLNGFDPLTFIATAGIFGAFGYFEYKTSLRRVDDKTLGKKHTEDMANVWKYGVPGDYNFDPLNLYSAFGDSADGRKAMRELEIAHGRSAMLGITGFAALEALTGHPIVENSLFFHPNAVLPLAGLAYLAFGFFYEVENNDQYMFQVKPSSEGAVRMERIKNWANRSAPKAQEQAGAVLGEAGKYAKIVADTASELKKKYDAATDDYTKSVMSKNYD